MGTPQQQTRDCLKVTERKKNWLLAPDGCLTPRQTGRLTVGGNFDYDKPAAI
jgi:hypothetical protein